jgi:uncharacterized protein (DUF2141 family)
MKQIPITGNEVELSLEQLPAGIYPVSIVTDKGVIVKKITKH